MDETSTRAPKARPLRPERDYAVPVPTADALPCPFCGAQPEIRFWHGGGPQKRFINCSNEDCLVGPEATGENKSRALRAWNTRAPVGETPIGFRK